MNGLPAIANNLATQGRYGDSMLVHMTPQEVGGLQALAQANGTSLTTNPDTGLPEAFKLKDILPMVAGFALGPAGFALMPAWGAGLAVGGIETLRTGDLGRGLMAGLGAYGGAGLGQALTSAGGQAAMSGEVARQAAGTAGAAQMGTQAGADAILKAGTAPGTFMGNMQMAGQGLQNLNTAAGWSNLGTGLQQAFPSTTAKVAAATPVVTGLSEQFSPKMAMPTPEDPYANYKGPYKPSERQVSYPGQLSSREWNYFNPSNPYPFAEGGAVEDRKIRMPGADYNVNQGEFNYNFRPVETAKAAAAAPATIGGKGKTFSDIFSRIFNKGDTANLAGYKYDPETQQIVKMARGGSVPQLEDGGFVLTKKAVDGLGKGSNKQGQRAAAMGLGALPIKGKGHGTSDSIKTTIDGKVPARVSNGEAYIPRSNVQRAGGAKKLYALMKKAERKV